MRFFTFSGFALALSGAMLSGCAGNSAVTSTPSVDGTASHVSMARSQGARPVLGSTNARPDSSCPYSGGCFVVLAGSPLTAEWCISSTGNCSSGLVGVWNWTATVTNVKTGKVSKPGKGPVTAVWSPDPGNPSTLTISTNFKKAAKHPKIVYTVAASTCDSSIGCFSDFVVYGIEN